MRIFFKALTFFCIVQIAVFAKQFETFYGPIEIEEPVLIELIESPAVQRLKSIHQYGIAYYTTHKEEYTRYAHCLGVCVILKTKGASLREQIAGLLHDVSHTVFSHVGDWIFAKENQEEGYHEGIHLRYLKQSGVTDILHKHGYSAEELMPKEEYYPALEQKGPSLCADRIDYNIQGAYYQNFITQEEGVEILNDLSFVNGKWVATNIELMEKLVRFSLFMTIDCWGSAANYASSRWLADAMIKAIALGCLTMKEIHFGTDEFVWNTLNACIDPDIQKKMAMMHQIENHYQLVDPEDADILVRSKFRGIDPWMMHQGTLVRLTSIDPAIAEEYRLTKEVLHTGWPIKFAER